MNDREAMLLEPAAERLAEMGVEFTWSLGRNPRAETDGTAQLRLDNQVLELPLETKTQVRPATLGPLTHPRMRGRLLVTHHVTPTVGQQLRHHGVYYVDSAGNAFVAGDGVRLFVDGRRPAPDVASARASLFSPAAMPVILALLDTPSLITAPLRKIQARADVSLGTVQRVLRQLKGEGLTQPPTPGVDQTRWRRLLDGWTTAYLTSVRDRLLIRRFTTDLPTSQFLGSLSSLPALLSGEAAAHAAGFDIRPGSVDLYLHGDAGPVIMAGRLRPDPEGWVILRRTMWSPQMDDRTRSQHSLAPAPVRYADLAAQADPRIQILFEEVKADDPDLRPFFAP